MTPVTIFLFLVGAVLAWRFRVWILVPFSLIAIIVTVPDPAIARCRTSCRMWIWVADGICPANRLCLRPVGTNHVAGPLFAEANVFSQGIRSRALQANVSRSLRTVNGLQVLRPQTQPSQQKGVWRR